jgi:hypothetical protein
MLTITGNASLAYLSTYIRILNFLIRQGTIAMNVRRRLTTTLRLMHTIVGSLTNIRIRMRNYSRGS